MWVALFQRRLGLIAAGVAFWAMFSIFPGVASLLALWGLLSDPVVVQQQVDILDEIMPAEGLQLLLSQIDRLIRADDGALGWTTIMSMIATIWSSRLGVDALIQGLNAIHGENSRGTIRHTVVALLLTLSLMGVTIIALVSILVLPIVFAVFPVISELPVAIVTGNWLVTLTVVLVGISLLYRFGPSKRPRTPWLSPGLALSLALWLLASLAFSWALGSVWSFNEIYGSLGAAIALQIWFYLSAYSVLLGALLNAEIEREVLQGPEMS